MPVTMVWEADMATTAEQAKQARAFAEMRAAVARLKKEIAARLPEKRESVADAVARWLDEAA